MSLSHAQNSQAQAVPAATGPRLIALLVILLVAALPLTRAALQISGAGTLAREQTALLELLVVGMALASRHIHVPPLGHMPRLVFWLLAAWFVWSAVAVALSPIPAVSLVRQAEWTLHGLFAWTLWTVFNHDPGLRTSTLRWTVWGLLLYLAPVGFFLGNLPDPFDFPWLGAMVGFNNIRHFGHYAAIGLVAAYLPFLTRGTAPPRLFSSFLILVVLWGTVFWSGGRGPLLALFGSMTILTVFRLIPSPRRIWGITLVTATAGALLAIPLTPPHGSFGTIRLGKTVEIADDMDRYSAGRLDIWRNVLEVVEDRPLFGVGPDQFRISVTDPTGWYAQHPHNGPLQAALDWGVPGALLCGAALLIAMLAAGIRLRRRYSPERLIGLWLLMMLLLFSLVSGTLYYALPLAFMAVALALMFARDKPRPKAAFRDAPPRLFAGLYGAAALILLAGFASTMAMRGADAPAMDSARTAYLKAFPSAMGTASAGPRLDGWITQWRAAGLTDGHDWLDWTIARSATPWTSMALKGRFLMEDGRTAEADHWLRAAAARQHPLWQPSTDDTE